jgi:lysozyme family protein
LARFEDCIGFVLKNEGGFANVPADRGGATNWGITSAVLAAWRKVRGVTVEQMRSLPIAEAQAIYRAKYWATLALDLVADPGVATELLDTAVNRGPARAIQYWQVTLAQLGEKRLADGKVSAALIGETNEVHPDRFIAYFETQVEAGYLAIIAHNASQIIFRNGWMARARRLLTLIRSQKTNAPSSGN